MKKFLVIWKVCFLLSFSIVSTTLTVVPEVKAYFISYFPLLELAGQLKSPDDIAHFIWRNFSFETDRTQFGQDDYWQTPEELLASGKGDCEDFARFASELLKMKGQTSFLLSIYGDRFSHTVCVFKKNGKFNTIDGTHVIRHETADLNQLLSEIYPFWKKGAIVSPSTNSKRGKTLAQFQRNLQAQHRLSISA